MSTDLNIAWARWEASGRVGARAEVQDVRLWHAETQLHAFDAEAPYRADLTVNTQVQRAEGSGSFVVSADYVLKALGRVPDDEGEDDEPDYLAAEFTFTLIALYQLREEKLEVELTDGELEAFSDSVGLMALHPYAREFIQDQTARVGLPSLTLGVARIVQGEGS